MKKLLVSACFSLVLASSAAFGFGSSYDSYFPDTSVVEEGDGKYALVVTNTDFYGEEYGCTFHYAADGAPLSAETLIPGDQYTTCEAFYGGYSMSYERSETTRG